MLTAYRKQLENKALTALKLLLKRTFLRPKAQGLSGKLDRTVRLKMHLHDIQQGEAHRCCIRLQCLFWRIAKSFKTNWQKVYVQRTLITWLKASKRKQLEGLIKTEKNKGEQRQKDMKRERRVSDGLEAESSRLPGSGWGRDSANWRIEMCHNWVCSDCVSWSWEWQILLVNFRKLKWHSDKIILSKVQVLNVYNPKVTVCPNLHRS